MTKSKSLQRALVMSVISILVCCAMLVGATFAWFSDTVSTGVNTIIAGNLKVDIQDSEGNSLVGTSLFNFDLDDDGEDDVIWEPGMMFVSDSFVIANLGTVALQYSVTTVMEDIITTDDDHGLSEVIQYKVAKATDTDVADTSSARAEFWAELEDGNKMDTLGVAEDDSTSDELVVVLYWAPTANDNDYNVDADADQLKTEFSISVYAAQVASENDGIGDKYDDFTLLSGHYDSYILLKGNAILADDITVGDVVAFVGAKSFIFDLNGHNIDSATTDAALWLETDADVTINGNGVVSATNGYYSVWVLDNAKATINGGEYMQGVYAQTWGYPYQVPSIVINDGIFHGYINVNNNDGVNEQGIIVINGGDFTDALFEKFDVDSGLITFSAEWLAQWELVDGSEAGHYTAVPKA